MKRPGKTWLVFGLAVAFAAAALGWVSATALRLEAVQWRSAAIADREEQVRLALWRMDSALTALILEESARPIAAYQPFLRSDLTAEFHVPSPLLVVTSRPTRFHFEIDPRGTLTSPQNPMGAERAHAERLPHFPARGAEASARRLRFDLMERLLGTGVIPGSGTNLLAPSPAYPRGSGEGGNRQALLAYLRRSRPLPPLPPAIPIEPSAHRLTPSPGDLSQVLRNTSEQQARAHLNRLSQNTAIQFSPPPNPTLSPPSEAGTFGVFRPVLLRHHRDEVILFRTIHQPQGAVIQGCWLDWPDLRSWLLDLAVDVLPSADLEPLPEPEAAQDPRALATLPIRLITPPLQLESRPWRTPTRASLGIAWASMGLAVIALAGLLHGAIALGERRAAFVSAVTHELRSPLTTFRMYSEMLADGMVPDESTRKRYLATLCAEADRLGLLIENVLAFAGLERGSARRRLETISVGALLDRVQPRLAQRTAQAGLSLVRETTPAAAAAAVEIDVSTVEQILFNLVDNACKYGMPFPPENRIHLDADLAGDEVRIRVRDHGPGVAPAHVKRLFRPFHLPATPAVLTSSGIGLGLALSRRLSRGLGGDLRLENSDAPGACLVLSLPVKTGDCRVSIQPEP